MRLRSLIGAAILAATFTLPEAAEAGSAYATGSVVLRSGPGTGYGRIVVIPAKAKVGVYRCAAWCEVTWGPWRGYAWGGFIAVGKEKFADRLLITPVESRHGNTFAPIYVTPQQAYITSQVAPRGGWPSARLWYYDGRWLDRPDYFLIVER